MIIKIIFFSIFIRKAIYNHTMAIKWWTLVCMVNPTCVEHWWSNSRYHNSASRPPPRSRRCSQSGQGRAQGTYHNPRSGLQQCYSRRCREVMLEVGKVENLCPPHILPRRRPRHPADKRRAGSQASLVQPWLASGLTQEEAEGVAVVASPGRPGEPMLALLTWRLKPVHGATSAVAATTSWSRGGRCWGWSWASWNSIRVKLDLKLCLHVARTGGEGKRCWSTSFFGFLKNLQKRRLHFLLRIWTKETGEEENRDTSVSFEFNSLIVH